MTKLLSLRLWILIIVLHLLNSTAISVATEQSGDFYCLQFRTIDRRGDQRLLLDVYTGKQVLTRDKIQLIYTPLEKIASVAAPSTSPDGKYTVRATYDGLTAYLWIEGEGMSDRVLVQMPIFITLFEWLTDRHFVAVSMHDPEMTLVAIDLQSGIPIVMRQEFSRIANFDVTPPRFANALQVRFGDDAGLLKNSTSKFWVAERNAWVTYDLTLPTGPVGGLPFTPGFAVPKAVYGFDHQTVHGFVVVDPAHGVEGVISYPGSVGLDYTYGYWVQWLPDGKHILVRHSKDGGTTIQIEVWQLDGATPILTGKGSIPSESTSIPIWAADGSSFIYISTAPDHDGRSRQFLNLHRLNKATETDNSLFNGNSVVRTFVAQSVPAPTVMLASTLDDRHFKLYWIDADGTTRLLAENGQHAPLVSFYEDYAYTTWQTMTDRRLLIIDMKEGHHVSIPISPTLEIAYPYGKLRNQTGDLSILVLGSTDQRESTFHVVNRRTGQDIQLLTEQGQVRWVAPTPQSGQFQVGWLTPDGQRKVTVFGPDTTPQVTFSSPQSVDLTFQPRHTKISPDGSRAIVYEGLLGDHYLSFADGSFKELLPMPATLMWMPDGKHIVGVEGVLNTGAAAYLLDADGTLLARYPIPYPAQLAPIPLVKCP